MFPCRGTDITRNYVFPVYRGTHITSIGICVPWVGGHISLGIWVSCVGEHILLGIYVSCVGEHIPVGICVSCVG